MSTMGGRDDKNYAKWSWSDKGTAASTQPWRGLDADPEIHFVEVASGKFLKILFFAF